MDGPVGKSFNWLNENSAEFDSARSPVRKSIGVTNPDVLSGNSAATNAWNDARDSAPEGDCARAGTAKDRAAKTMSSFLMVAAPSQCKRAP